MKRKANLLGSRFGTLVVVEEHGASEDRGALWVCRCDCGNRIIRATRELRRVKRAACQECHARHMSDKFSVHGMSRSRDGRPDPLYKAWLSMRERCSNPAHPFYKNYGGKGVVICPEWDDFLPFKSWSEANGWRDIPDVPRGDRMSIDRIDPAGDYSPDNCRWVAHRVNASRKTA